MYMNVLAPLISTYFFNWGTLLEEGLLFLNVTEDELIKLPKKFLFFKPLLGLVDFYGFRGN